jgi:hypothetical protein
MASECQVRAHQLQQVSQCSSLELWIKERAETCDEFEGLRDHTTELFGVWNLNVGHFDGIVQWILGWDLEDV